MQDLPVIGYTEISGNITSKFGVKPVVLGYENGTYELIYAPKELNYVFKSDGKIAKHNKIPIVLQSQPIKIPDIDKMLLNSKTKNLPEVNLNNPNSDNIRKYIEMSQQGIEYTSNLSYDELKSLEISISKPKITLPSSRKLPVKPLEIIVPQIEIVTPIPQVEIITPCNSALPQQFDVENEGLMSPKPKITKPKKVVVSLESTSEIKELKIEVAELRSMLKALTQRIYQLYPVEMPQELRYNNKIGPVIPFEDIKKKMADNQITGMVVEPLFQPYGGSHRGTNRILTFTDKEGKIYHVRADHDCKTNSINPPK